MWGVQIIIKVTENDFLDNGALNFYFEKKKNTERITFFFILSNKKTDSCSLND